MTAVRRPLVLALTLVLAGCGLSGDRHRFTDVVGAKASPDDGVVAALVWEERGVGKPHVTGIVLGAKGTDPRDGDAVLLASEDYRAIDYHWTGPDALDLRLPCGGWSSLANQWRLPGTKRIVAIDFLPPKGCMAKATALPAGASQSAGLMLSPN